MSCGNIAKKYIRKNLPLRMPIFLVNSLLPRSVVWQIERRMADWKMFAELRKQFREKNPGPREDDFLDDEQWYCENAAEWGKSYTCT